MQWKLFTAGVILAGVSAAGLVWQQIQDRPAAANDQPEHPRAVPTTAAPTSPGDPSAPPNSPTTTTTTTTTAPQVLPTYPPSFPGRLARAIADHDGTVCELFTPRAAKQFATATGTGSCPAAIEAMAAKVTDVHLYSNPSGPSEAQPAGKRRVIVDGCHLTWSTLDGPATPGPQVGMLTLEQPDGSVGYLIAGYRAC